VPRAVGRRCCVATVAAHLAASGAADAAVPCAHHAGAAAGDAHDLSRHQGALILHPEDAGAGRGARCGGAG
jgi:hypothetical protein